MMAPGEGHAAFKLTTAGRRELAYWLRGAGLPVARNDGVAFAAWVDWLLVQRGQTNARTASTITAKWRARLQAAHGNPYTGSESLARARAHNLLGLALGVGGVVHLAALAGRTRFHLQRLLDGQRHMGERGARELEEALQLEAGWLDGPRLLSQSMDKGAHIKQRADAGGKGRKRPPQPVPRRAKTARIEKGNVAQRSPRK